MIIEINNCEYKTHPIYTLYAASKDGRIIHIVKQVPNKGNKNNIGYLIFKVRKFGESGFKNYYVHRFIWETYNSIIPDGKEIHHIDNNKENNRLSNLQLITHSENCKKAAKKKINNYQNIRRVKAINKETYETLYYFSIYSAGKHLQINRASVIRVCDGITKSALSKKDNCRYTFKYVEKDLSVNYIKSKNICQKTDEDKRKTKLDWWNKEWKCPKCGFIAKNNSKYRHRKKCNSL